MGCGMGRVRGGVVQRGEIKGMEGLEERGRKGEQRGVEAGRLSDTETEDNTYIASWNANLTLPKLNIYIDANSILTQLINDSISFILGSLFNINSNQHRINSLYLGIPIKH